jgi:catechol 2,3-dioxygenase-like lactoylglutathione lyase family enzyme
MRLTQAILFVVDAPRMTAFYTDALGLTVLDGDPADGFVRLDAGGCALALHAIPPEVADRVRIDDPARAREDSAIKLAFQVDDVDAARAPLAARGARMGVTRRHDGDSFCDGVDPEGNVFQITTR